MFEVFIFICFKIFVFIFLSISSLTQHLFRSMLFTYNIFVYVWVYMIVVTKDSWYEFILIFYKICFVVYYIVCPGEYSTCICKEHVFCCCWIKWSIIATKTTCSKVWFNSNVFCCWFSVWTIHPLLIVRYQSSYNYRIAVYLSSKEILLLNIGFYGYKPLLELFCYII